MTRRDFDGWPRLEVSPASELDLEGCVIFLHGGGWIKEMHPAHWRFLGKLAAVANVRCIVPIFPVAPRAGAVEVVPKVRELLREVIVTSHRTKVTVIGNSAGAGLALASTQTLRDAGHRLPERLILLSPLLDASLSHPQQLELAASDPLLAIPGLREAARLYAGDLGVEHPYVSPLRGEVEGLPPMTVFAGTRDLLYPDSIALAERAEAADVPVDLHLKLGQPHNYALLPTPEGREAFAMIAAVLRGEAASPRKVGL